jgi:hypothetical protein
MDCNAHDDDNIADGNSKSIRQNRALGATHQIPKLRFRSQVFGKKNGFSSNPTFIFLPRTMIHPTIQQQRT